MIHNCKDESKINAQLYFRFDGRAGNISCRIIGKILEVDILQTYLVGITLSSNGFVLYGKCFSTTPCKQYNFIVKMVRKWKNILKKKTLLTSFVICVKVVYQIILYILFKKVRYLNFYSFLSFAKSFQLKSCLDFAWVREKRSPRRMLELFKRGTEQEMHVDFEKKSITLMILWFKMFCVSIAYGVRIGPLAKA